MVTEMGIFQRYNLYLFEVNEQNFCSFQDEIEMFLIQNEPKTT